MSGEYQASPYQASPYQGGAVIIPPPPANPVIEAYIGGAWIDLSTQVDRVQGITVKVGRPSQFVDAAPGELSFQLSNETGDLTPGNPLSIYFPDLVEGIPIRATITHASISYRRFSGWVTTWSPVKLDTGEAMVAVTATDALGRMGQRTLDNEWTEAWAYRAKTEVCDAWPLDDGAPTTTNPRSIAGNGTLVLNPGPGGVGSAQLGSVDQGIALPGAFDLTPASSGIGATLAMDLQRTVGGGVFTFAIKTSAVPATTSSSDDIVLLTTFDVNGGRLWSLRIHRNVASVDLQLLNEQTMLYSGTLVASGVGGDDQWRLISCYDSGGNSRWFVNNGGATYQGVGVAGVRYAIFGGLASSWRTITKPSQCGAMSVAGIAASSSTTYDLFDHARPLAAVYGGTRMVELINHYMPLSRSGLGFSSLLTRTETAGRTVLDCALQVHGSCGATMYHDYPLDQVVSVWSAAARPITPTLTLQVDGTDDDAASPMTLVRSVDARPTRVTVTFPAGSVTLVDEDAEATGLRREETYASCALGAAQATPLAGFRLNRSTGTRVSQVAIDLLSGTLSRDLYAQAMAIRPGHRIRLDKTPVTQMGVEYQDVYALGWTEHWSMMSCSIVFDTELADAPPEARFDDATYGRFAFGEGAATVTGGTAVGTTTNGTLIVDAPVGPWLTVNSAMYPLDLDWNGERVTISAAPASAVGPQTVTTTARGVGASVARVHAAGEPVDIFDGMRFAL